MADPVRRGHRDARPEQGSMTLLAAGLMVALLVAAVVAVGLAGLVVVQHQAAAAADLAALAGARSPDRGCQVARRVAADNAATLDDCEVVGAVVTVEVRIEAQAPFGYRPSISSRARAGPAELTRRDAADDASRAGGQAPSRFRAGGAWSS